MSEFLFVYGTLMKDAGHPMSRRLERDVRRLGPATFNGRLYRVSSYPGAVPSASADDQVHGEVYELGVDALETLAALDRYEGCGAGFAQPTEYVREQRSILMSGMPLKAWIYLYNYPVAGLEQIASGRFLGPTKNEP